MNRQIKFRAWDTVTNKFIATGFHVVGEVTMFGMIDQYVLENKLNKTILDRYNDIVITQFTGLLDKNGKEIYEGDIVEVWGGEQSQGFWEISIRGQFAFSYNSFLIKDKKGVYYDPSMFDATIQIIGNQFENPELL